MRFLFSYQFDTFGSVDGRRIDGRHSLAIVKKHEHFS